MPWCTILLELDEKLIRFLRGNRVRSKGGVVNIHVVRAATTALIASNPSTSQQLLNFDMPRLLVQSIYRRSGNFHCYNIFVNVRAYENFMHEYFLTTNY